MTSAEQTSITVLRRTGLDTLAGNSIILVAAMACRDLDMTLTHHLLMTSAEQTSITVLRRTGLDTLAGNSIILVAAMACRDLDMTLTHHLPHDVS